MIWAMNMILFLGIVLGIGHLIRENRREERERRIHLMNREKRLQLLTEVFRSNIERLHQENQQDSLDAVYKLRECVNAEVLSSMYDPYEDLETDPYAMWLTLDEDGFNLEQSQKIQAKLKLSKGIKRVSLD